MCKFWLDVCVVITLVQIQFISGDLSIDQKIREGNRKRQRELGVRLVGGSSSLEGRIEIWHNNTWGTVCDDRFDRKDAEVICHMLGYHRLGATPYMLAEYGKGNGPIWLDELQCHGIELSAKDCPHLPWGSHDCRHIEDAGVKCRAKKNDRRNRMITLEHDIVVEETEKHKIFDRYKSYRKNAVKDPSKRWYGGTIVYVFGDGIDNNTANLIRDALDEWGHYSCIDFSKSVSNDHYNQIVFTSNQDYKGCASTHAGMKPGSQKIHLGKDCFHVTSVVIGHDGSGSYPDWLLEYVSIYVDNMKEYYVFRHNDWVKAERDVRLHRQEGCILPENSAKFRYPRTAFNVGETLTEFDCDPGFIVSSPSRMTCQKGGSWSDNVVCQRGCTLPNHAANHKRWGTTFSPGETVNNFYCKHGYVLSSEKGMTCQRGGSWSEIVTCIKGCSLPNHAANHKHWGTTFDPGETVNNFYCKHGYVLSSEKGMICQRGGSWSEIVTCIKGCTLPNHAANHKDRETTVSPGETLNNFFCDHGYVLSSEKGMTCRHDGSWSHTVTCTKGCTLPNHAANSKDWRTTFNPGEALNNFYCDHGYVLSSQKGMTCRHDGSWSEIVTCIQVLDQQTCIDSFDSGHNWWYLKWESIRSKGVYYISRGRRMSLRECKQACINLQGMQCKAVMYDNYRKSCWGFAVSDTSYFSERYGTWSSRVYLRTCKQFD